MFGVFSVLTDPQRQPQDTIASARLIGEWRCSLVLYFSSRHLSHSRLTTSTQVNAETGIHVYRIEVIPISFYGLPNLSILITLYPPSLSHTVGLTKEGQTLPLLIASGHPTLPCLILALSCSMRTPSLRRTHQAHSRTTYMNNEITIWRACRESPHYF